MTRTSTRGDTPQKTIGELLEQSPAEKPVEIAAAALYNAEMDGLRLLDPSFEPRPWDAVHDEHRRRYRKLARRVVEAILGGDHAAT